MGKLQISFDGWRINTIEEMTELGDELKEALDELDDNRKASIIDKFDTVACSFNFIKSVWVDGVENFSNLDKSPEVPLLGEYDE
ncbi:hypothetical protein [Photobacterium kishitanii]|uniref:Uncharacterized protein n=1 Tax=Photobacterium kishitanii TaxID=318456 RepID=A0A2T3KKT0_9GAMM|nr:hypothetical protein [Photobacterium kishitanii]PSV00328.1 hypothetical protein C9J27_04170 [Photobacterium kishitanii]